MANPIDDAKLDAAALAKQLGNPTGEIGKAVVDRLNNSNATNYAAALRRMQIENGARVLEIGFGNGHEIANVLSLADGVQYCGIEISETMVGEATTRLASDIASSRVMLHLGSSAALPYGDAVFDRVLALNTIYFWPDPRVDLKEIRRVLRSSGRAVLGAVAPWSTEGRDVFRHGFGLYDERQLSAMLMEAGFDTVSVDMITETVQMASGPWTRDYFIICAE